MDWQNFGIQFLAQFLGILLSGLLLAWVTQRMISKYFQKGYKGVVSLSTTQSIVQTLYEINSLLASRGGRPNKNIEKDIIARFNTSRLIAEKYFGDLKLDNLYSELHREGLLVSLEGSSGTDKSSTLIAKIILRLYEISDEHK